MTTYALDLHPDERRRRETEKRRRNRHARGAKPAKYVVTRGVQPRPVRDFAAIRFAWYLTVCRAERRGYWSKCYERLVAMRDAKRCATTPPRAKREEMAEELDTASNSCVNSRP